MSNNFMEFCLQGKARPEDIDTYIEQWHNSDSQREVYEFLGLTWEEYSAWIMDRSVLPAIITAHLRSARAARSYRSASNL